LRAEVARDLAASASDFERLVWPAIAPLVGGGRYVAVESVAHGEIAGDLDRLAGIDAYQISDDKKKMRGLASRVQPTDRPWNTFSIRYSRRNGSETEYAKRMQAIRERERGWLLPALTVQAYVTKDRAQLLSACVVGTVSLFEFLQEQMTHAGDCCVELKTTGSDGARFLAVKWSALRAAGIKILTWPTAGQALVSGKDAG